MNNDINNKDIVKINEIDKAQSNCAVVGIYGHPHAALMTYYMLHSLQHRGQEATGITTFYKKDDTTWYYASHRRNGLVMDTFSNPALFTDKLVGTMAIGHNRYATTGSAIDSNISPLNMRYKSGILALSHNGNLSNTHTLRSQLENEGAIFHTTTDSELFLHLTARSKKTSQIEQIREALTYTKGAYSLAILTQEGLVACRDPHGVRPLSIGKVKVDGHYAYCVASETCAFDMIDAEEIRTVKHNEMIVINDNTLVTGEILSYKIEPETPIAKHCIFEYIYFSRPDSRIFGHNVDKVRRKLGKNLAEEFPTELANTDPEKQKVRVISVPDSGNTAALGYARANQKENKIETAYEIGLIRSHYVGRTFIQSGQDNREFKVKSKFNTVKGVIDGWDIVVVDDSIVRGTTSKALIKLIKNAKPNQLHLRITSPPIKFPCHYGMDFPSKKELIANDYDNEKEIGDALGVDSLHYLSKEKLLEAVSHEEGIDYCTACFTGEYPIELESELES
ncbi:MAG: amidophosphoribosyltransferase [Ignavibacteria bacterium]|jgi:amidophosphoribosyltransferase|nr:amidophosphoribosyltransferase [Ignavibacteria bacterium]